MLERVPGLTEFIAWIDERGLKKAAVTNAPRENARVMLAALGLGCVLSLHCKGTCRVSGPRGCIPSNAEAHAEHSRCHRTPVESLTWMLVAVQGSLVQVAATHCDFTIVAV